MPWTVSASRVARLLSGEKVEGTPERAELGKLFEEGYQNACWELGLLRCAGPSGGPDAVNVDDYLLDDFVEIVVDHVSRCGELVDETHEREAAEIAEAFLRAGVAGRTPATKFRKIEDDRYVAAKPDLVDDLAGLVVEFKIYEPGEYAKAQSEVFSWVFRYPVWLVGWDGVSVVSRLVEGRDLELPAIPEGKFSWTDECRVLGLRRPFYHRPWFDDGNNDHGDYYDEYLDGYWGYDEDYDDDEDYYY
ncbi:MAG: hypothetical protein Kow0069_23870 [Promethearchaeota archaeon]